MSNENQDFTAIQKATQQFQGLRIEHWLEHDVFSLNWWFLLVITIIPWVIWWRLVDRKRMAELVCVGALIALISVIMDTIGTVNSWWLYKTELLIQFPGLLVADIADLPVTYMLVYQYCRTWKSFLITMGIISLLFAFVIEPFFRCIDAYRPLTWEHLYSFMAYLFMGVIVRFLVLKMKPVN